MSEQEEVGTKPVITYFDGVGHGAGQGDVGRASKPFIGTARFADGLTSRLVVQMTTESRTGEIAGTILADGGVARGSHLYLFRGNSRRRVFTLQALATGNRVAMLSGTISSDGNRVTGTFVASEPGRTGGGGTFEVSRE